ncbi:MAG: nicotinate-nucleotide--dimethylbenzimidazole phosphoribosyltransferase [Firmicutes bacterium]|nr:nicotinate-nucleotide--dimethylbenzimidazole phosphoribosyltransferase [Bacillota bacterium]
MELLKNVVDNIKPADYKAMQHAAKRLDSLVKPIGSLGRLEDIAIKIAGISGKLNNYIKKKCIIVMAADNGICEEGVSSVPQIITAMQAVNMTRGLAGISVLCRHAYADLRVVDIGIKEDYDCEDIINMKIRRGTWNFSKGPAMTKEEAIRGIEIGIRITEELIAEGYDLIGTGEMGIGNTSSSSAIIMSFTGLSAEEAVGKGAGLTDEGLKNKKKVISRAIEINKPDKSDPIDVLSKVGGFDIAGLTGCFLAAARYRIPVVIDGIISAAAAMMAYKINPFAKDYMIPSHISEEPGFQIVMKEMGLIPVLDLGMRLGEGTGCALMFNVIEAALRIINEMATFEQVSMENDFLVDIRKRM